MTDPIRFCKACQKQLRRGLNEYPSQFAARKYCSRACCNQARRDRKKQFGQKLNRSGVGIANAGGIYPGLHTAHGSRDLIVGERESSGITYRYADERAWRRTTVLSLGAMLEEFGYVRTVERSAAE